MSLFFWRRGGVWLSNGFELTWAPFGAQAYFETGSPFQDQSKAICGRAGIILKGPVELAVENLLDGADKKS
jgi:hypothetical protein